MKKLKRDNILSYMKPGRVYRREDLLPLSNNLDRDLAALVKEQKLTKLAAAAGLYFKPKRSRFGVLPPDDKTLLKKFLKKPFLMFSWNDYNKLGLGLTQLYNKAVVYNSERHDDITLGGRTFSFKRPNNGFPLKLTREFLLIDLLNNAKYLTEDVKQLKTRVAKNLKKFNRSLLHKLSVRYGKVNTKKFIASLLEDKHVFT
jgi:hypothetical protein